MSDRTPSEPEAGLQGHLLDVREGAVRASLDDLVIRRVDVVSYPRESCFEARIAIMEQMGLELRSPRNAKVNFRLGLTRNSLEIQPQAVETDSNIAIRGVDLSKGIAGLRRRAVCEISK